MRALCDGVFAEVAPTPDHKLPDTRGVVTAAGTPEQWLGVWALIDALPDLPVEVWHLPGESVPDIPLPERVQIRRLQRPGVRGYAIKPCALWESAFQTAMWLDSDVLPVADLEPLFSEGPLAGSDAFRYSSPEILAAFDVSPGPEIESGLLVLDTVAHAAGLHRAVLLNTRYRRTVYAHVLGDKDTFRLAGLPFRMLETPDVVGHFAFRLQWRLRTRWGPPRDVGLLHSWQGRPLLVHRTKLPVQPFVRRRELLWRQSVPPMDPDDYREDPDGPVPTAVVDAERRVLERLASVDWLSGPLGFGAARRVAGVLARR